MAQFYENELCHPLLLGPTTSDHLIPEDDFHFDLEALCETTFGAGNLERIRWIYTLKGGRAI